MNKHSKNILTVLSILVALLAIGSSTATASGAELLKPPKATGGFLDPRDDYYPQPEYFSLIVQRAERVRVRNNGRSAFGRYEPSSSNTIRKGRSFDFGLRKKDRSKRMKRLIGSVFDEYDRKGRAKIKVRAFAGGVATDWSCRLTTYTRESRCRRL